MDDLCDRGKLSRNYCVDCMSRNTQPLSKWIRLLGNKGGRADPFLVFRFHFTLCIRHAATIPISGGFG